MPDDEFTKLPRLRISGAVISDVTGLQHIAFEGHVVNSVRHDDRVHISAERFGFMHAFDGKFQAHRILREMGVNLGHHLANMEDPLAIDSMTNDLARALVAETQWPSGVKPPTNLLDAIRMSPRAKRMPHA